jgi:protein-S-isoprenylcysteine O-methyltransferase Ste14
LLGRLFAHYADGLYDVVRNPMILAELVTIWGVALLLGSAGAAVYAAAVCIGAHLVVVRVEEPVLLERFGEDYEAYCARVRRWRPAPKVAVPVLAALVALVFVAAGLRKLIGA